MRSVGLTAREERVRHQAEGKVGPRELQSSAVEAPGVGDGVEHLDGVQVVSGPLPGVAAHGQHLPANVDQREAKPAHHHLSDRGPGLATPTAGGQSQSACVGNIYLSISASFEA